MKPHGDDIDMVRTGPGTLSAVLVLAVAAVAQPARAQGWNPPPPEKRCPSQWGDERGAANLQTPQAVLKATQMIREGKVYELGKVLEPSIPRSGARSYSLNLARTSGPNGRNQQRGNEETVFTELGQIGTQFDGLAHQALGPHLYNCVENDAVAARTGFTKLGVEKIGALFMRGVMLDIAALKGVEMLGDTYEITVADLQQALDRQKLKLLPGDAVIINTGWGKLYGKDNARFVKSTPGVGVAAAEWLAKQDPLLVGSDNWPVEVAPNPDKDLSLPVHQIFLAVNGIHILENLKLDELAAKRVYEFAFTMQPLKIQGASGSTVAPAAIR